MKKKSLSKAIFTALVVVLLLAVHSGVVAADDTLPPRIGPPSFSNCSIAIPITDNVAVDCSRSSIVIGNQPILLEEVCVGCGTPSVACTIGLPYLPESDKYELDIFVRDTSGNITAVETSVDGFGCTCQAVPNSITPSETGVHATVTLTVEGIDISAAGITSTCQGITVNSTEQSDTDAVDLNIKATAPCGTLGVSCPFIINIGNKSIECPFIINPAPKCPCKVVSAGLSPNSIFRLRSWRLMPHRAKIIIKGDANCDFTGVTASDITIQEIKVVEVISAAGNEIEAQIVIPPRISGFKPGEKEVTVNGVGGATLTIN